MGWRWRENKKNMLLGEEENGKVCTAYSFHLLRYRIYYDWGGHRKGRKMRSVRVHGK